MIRCDNTLCVYIVLWGRVKGVELLGMVSLRVKINEDSTRKLIENKRRDCWVCHGLRVLQVCEGKGRRREVTRL